MKVKFGMDESMCCIKYNLLWCVWSCLESRSWRSDNWINSSFLVSCDCVVFTMLQTTASKAKTKNMWSCQKKAIYMIKKTAKPYFNHSKMNFHILYKRQTVLLWRSIVSLKLELVKAHTEVKIWKVLLVKQWKWWIVVFLTGSMNARCAATGFKSEDIWRNTWQFILEKNHTNVVFVTRNFGLSTNTKYTSLVTKVNFHSVLCVVGDLSL